MSKRKPIISARRTENLEALLQKLWTLRPMYRNKQAFTIMAGVAALVREIEREDAFLGGKAIVTSQAGTATAHVPIEPAVADSNVSDDVEWD